MAVARRGLGRGLIEVETELRRPGQPFITKYEDLINLINKFIINEIPSNDIIDSIVQMIQDLIETNSLKDILNVLYKHALEDRQFGIKLAMVCGDAKLYSINNSQLRSILLLMIQNDYEDREKIKAKSLIHFRNTVSFLGEVYNSLKVNGPLKFLAVPLLKYLAMLLENLEEEDLELIIIQISINGRKIYEDLPNILLHFIINVRSVLINHNLNERFRKMLLYIIDVANQRYIPLSGKLQEFYVDQLGTDIFVKIQRYNKDLTINTDIEDSVDSEDNAEFEAIHNQFIHSTIDSKCDSILMKAPTLSKNLDLKENENNSKNSCKENFSI